MSILSVSKKKKDLPEIEKARIAMDKEAFKLEIGIGSESEYEKKKLVFENLLKNLK